MRSRLLAACQTATERLDARRAERLALFLSAVIFSAVAVFVTPELKGEQPLTKLIALALGTLSLSLMFVVLRWALNFVWARPLLGVWAYSSSLQSPQPVPAYVHALARFRLTPGGTLELRANHYETREAVMAAVRGEVRRSGAMLRSRAASCEDGKLRFLYEIEYFEAPDRPGQSGVTREGQMSLSIIGSGRSRILQGHWHSRARGSLEGGEIEMRRPNA